MKHNWNIEQIDDRAEGIIGVVLTAQSKAGGFMMQEVFSPKEARDMANALNQVADSLAPVEPEPEPVTTVEDLEQRADAAVPPFPEPSDTAQTEAPENGKVEEAVFSEA